MDLDINENELIVLSEFLRRYSENEVLGIEDQAEQRVLWNLECVIEKNIGNYYEGDWKAAVFKARDSLRDEGGTDATEEACRGRVALWVDPDQIELILSQWRELPSETNSELLDRWSNLAFRCNAALYKAGLKRES